MKQNDKLLELIKVLKPNEVLWVKKCLKAFKQKNNEVLFKYLEKQEFYSKKKLLSSLKKAPFLSYLAVQKNTLYNEVLRFLRLYMGDDGSHYKLWDSLHDLTFLKERGLTKHCIKLINKAKTTAIDEQQHHQLLQLISIERDIVSFHLSQSTSTQDMTSLIAIDEAYTEQLKLMQEMWYCRSWSSKISLLIQNPKLFSKEDREEILHDVKLFIDSHKLSEKPVARYYFFQLNLSYYNYIENYALAFLHAAQQIELLETVDINTSNARKNKVIIFVNSVTTAFLAGVADVKIDSLIEKTHTLLKQDKYISLHNTLYNILYHTQLNHYNQRSHTRKGTKLVKEILAPKVSSTLQISPSLTLSIASYYFEQGDYNQAITWNNQLKTLAKKKVGNLVHYNSLILKLLIHIELDEFFDLDSILQSIKRLLSKKEELSNEFNYSVYNFFKGFESKVLSISPDTTSLSKVYHDSLLSQPLIIRKNLPFIHLLNWLNSKAS
jgi:hypothetical protein